MKRSRLPITLLLALILASAAAIGVYSAATQLQPESSAEGAPPTPTPAPTASVLVATRDIAAATTITAEMVEVREIPLELRNERALAELDQAVGKMAAVALAKGEQILDSRVTDAPVTQTNTFAGTVPVGMRAISLVFDEVIGSGALVQPGDHVDVLAYFELEVKDFSVGTSDGSEDDSENADNQSQQDSYDYKQYVSTYIVQNVEVLAVSQAISPDQLGVDGQAALPTPTPAGDDKTPTADSDEDDDPVARPTAKSVTLAVTPEQAQRLLLASQTVKNERGSLRLAMRAPGDNTIAELPPAQLGTIPVGDILGSVDQPLLPSDVVITHAQFTERVLTAGSVLEFTATVKNVSNKTIKSGADAAPGYEYIQGLAYDSLGFFPEKGTYRLGLNVAGAYPNQFPYRWGFGKDLEPGESVEITGSVRLTEATAGTRYWFGMIEENGSVTQDGIGVADITVVPSEAATVSAKTAELRADANGSAEVVAELKRGDELEVLSARGAWFEVRIGEQEGWIEVAAVKVPQIGSQTGGDVAESGQ